MYFSTACGKLKRTRLNITIQSMKSLKTYVRPAVATLAIVAFLGSSFVTFAAPRDLKITTRNASDTADVSEAITPFAYDDGLYAIPMFYGAGSNDGTYHSVDIGSGFSVLGNIIAVTPNTIETPDGHLTQTLNNMQSAISLLGMPFNMDSFLATYATSTTRYLASTTSNGLFSIAEKAKLASLSAQLPTDWTEASSTALDFIKNKPTLSPNYEGTTLHANSFPIFKSATVSSGTAVLNLTADGTSGGTALCTGGVIQDSVNPIVNDAAASYQMSWAFSNSNKTLTITANKLTTSNILTGVLGQAAANTAVVKVSAWCYA